MTKRMRLGIIISVALVLLSIVASLGLSFISLETANEVIDSKNEELQSKDKEIKDRERDVEIVRNARDRWADTAKQTNDEKVEINCTQFDRVNGFVTLIATLLDQTPELSPEQRAGLTPYLEMLPRPDDCPAITPNN